MPAAPLDSYLREHPKSPFLYYVRDVPEDVRSRVGKTRWKFSLKTASRKDALKLARRYADEHDLAVAEARAPKLDPIDTLTPEQRQTIEAAGGVSGFLDWLNTRAAEAGSLKDETETLTDWAADDGPGDEVPDPDWARAKASGLSAERKATEAHIARDAPIIAQLGYTPARLHDERKPFLAQALASAVADPDTITLKGVFESWKAQKRPTAPEQYEYPVRLFEDLHGPLPLKQIGKHHVREFRGVVQKLPRGGTPEWKRLTLQQMFRRADERNLPTLGESTAAKYFRSIKTIFGFAMSEGYITDSPADGLKFHVARKKSAEVRKAKRRSLSPDEIVRFLGAVERERADSPDEIWFVRLLVYTGARPEEIAQLAPFDIKIGEKLRYLRIHDEGQNRVKSDSSVRIVPVHPRLLELGFEEFVTGKKRCPYLFTFEANGKGRRYANIQRRLMNVMRKHAKIVDPRAVIYSLRHAFKDSMRMIHAPEEIEERIMGHRSPERAVPRGYGDLDQLIQLLAPWMNKVDPLNQGRTSDV